jgi:hypothetical protein
MTCLQTGLCLEMRVSRKGWQGTMRVKGIMQYGGRL